MDDGLAARHRQLDERAPIDLTKREAMILVASLHQYLEGIERRAAEDNHHNGESVAATRHSLGQLIWRLEDAAAWPRPVGSHSADAVPPD